ncbi:MAG: hypothetical protein RIQ94_1541 [Pseudomonadota bacterium]
MAFENTLAEFIKRAKQLVTRSDPVVQLEIETGEAWSNIARRNSLELYVLGNTGI